MRCASSLCALTIALTACSGHARTSPRDAVLTDAAGLDGGFADADAGVLDPSRPPAIRVGLDAYLDWRHMYRPKLGVRTSMRSTYDRSGGNEGADASHFLRAEAADFNVTFDVAGPGVVYFVRTNHWHGSPWQYVIDGNVLAVSESSTADPSQPVSDSSFMPAIGFPNPLTYTWSTTYGSDLSWVPIEFERGFTLGYARTHYGSGYYIYQQLPLGAADLSHAITSFTGMRAPSQAVLALLSSAGSDLGAHGPSVANQTGKLDVGANQTTTLAELSGPQTIVALTLTAADSQGDALDQARLRIYWDGRDTASVDAPLPLFFGTGTFYNRDQHEWLVRALLFGVQQTSGQLRLASYFPMPFSASARIELVAGAQALPDVSYEIRSEPLNDPEAWIENFHASYRDHGVPIAGQDLTLLQTDTVEGAHDYCGQLVGTSFVFSDRADLTTLEGDPRFFFDDSSSAQAYGTGTEEWAGGGDYWGGHNVTLPLVGHPVGALALPLAFDPRDRIESAYRLLIADAMPFGKNARIQLEHGGEDQSTEHYRSVVYWYGRPEACLVQTDALHVGDLDDELAHAYASPSASDVQAISSRYELGVDHTADGAEVIAESTDSGRVMTGTSELTFDIRPDNFGVLLRRKLDYAWPDQRANVFVAGVDEDNWQAAGVWYLAGSNRCVYSNPAGELDAPQWSIEVSNRRFRDDEFLIAATLTRGRARLRVRIVFDAAGRPLLPGDSTPYAAWSELRYSAYAWILPVASSPDSP